MSIENAEWLTTMREHDGQPLAIRLRPPFVVNSYRGKYKYLFVVSHQLAVLRPDGMPDAKYNEGLLNFDCELISELEERGRVVLVETYSGERIYYAYVADEITSKDLSTTLPSICGGIHELSFRGGPDADWVFYSRYTDEML